MKRYEDYTEAELQELKENPVKLTGVAVAKSECDGSRPCVATEYFEQIEKCVLCQKLK